MLRVLGCLGVALLGASAAADSVLWYVSLEYAKTVARQRNCPILVYFVRESRPAAALDDEWQFDRQVAAALRDFVTLRLKIRSDGQGLAARLGAPREGTIAILDQAGERVAMLQGFDNMDTFLFESRRALASFRERERAAARLRKDPKDVGALLSLSVANGLAANPDGAQALIAKAETYDRGRRNAAFALAYYTIGDYFQTARQFDKAIGFFEKALKSASNDADRAYSLISIGSCYLQDRKPALSRPYFLAVTKLRSASVADLATAQRLLQGNRRSRSSAD